MHPRVHDSFGKKHLLYARHWLWNTVQSHQSNDYEMQARHGKIVVVDRPILIVDGFEHAEAYMLAGRRLAGF